jgi:translocation and assembly module TamB
VHVRRAEIRIPERMPAGIAVLPVNRPGTKPAPPASVSVIALDIALDAERQVYVRGRGLDVEFAGAMKLGGTTVAPRTTGGFDLRRGGISLAGRSLDFTEGRISFDGGSITDPALRLVASSTSGNVVATLTIGGTAHAPKITLSSTPPLPQDEVLAHLLFGSGVGRLGALEVAGIAASLATLTGNGGGFGDPLDKVRQGLGLDRLGVRNGANGSPALEVGRYIAPRVFLGARQSASGGTQANVQFDITKGLKLEATTGAGGGGATGSTAASNGSSVGLTYQFEY